MKALEYPFDADYILSKKRKIKKELYEKHNNWLDKNIAILGGSTTENIKLILELFLLEQGIRPNFYQSEYNKWYEDAIFSNPQLEQFKPDIIYIHTTNKNITAYPVMLDSAEQVDLLIEREMQKYISVWETLREKYNCPIIQNNFDMPFTRLLGNRDTYDIHGKVNFLSRINMKFAQYVQEHENIYLCDINYISGDYGLRKWADSFYWHMYKYAVSVPAIPYLAFNVSNIIK